MTEAGEPTARPGKQWGGGSKLVVCVCDDCVNRGSKTLIQDIEELCGKLYVGRSCFKSNLCRKGPVVQIKTRIPTNMNTSDKEISVANWKAVEDVLKKSVGANLTPVECQIGKLKYEARRSSSESAFLSAIAKAFSLLESNGGELKQPVLASQLYVLQAKEQLKRAPEAALADAEKALKLTPDWGTVFAVVAAAKEFMGDMGGAWAALKKAIAFRGIGFDDEEVDIIKGRLNGHLQEPKAATEIAIHDKSSKQGPVENEPAMKSSPNFQVAPSAKAKPKMKTKKVATKTKTVARDSMAFVDKKYQEIHVVANSYGTLAQKKATESKAQVLVDEEKELNAMATAEDCEGICEEKELGTMTTAEGNDGIIAGTAESDSVHKTLDFTDQTTQYGFETEVDLVRGCAAILDSEDAPASILESGMRVEEIDSVLKLVGTSQTSGSSRIEAGKCNRHKRSSRSWFPFCCNSATDDIDKDLTNASGTSTIDQVDLLFD